MRTTEWLNTNANRRYPVVENADMLGSGGLVLPNDFLLDFNAVCYATDNTGVILRQIEVIGAAPATVLVTFTILASSTDVVFSLADNMSFPHVTQVNSVGVHTTAAAFGDGVIAVAALGPATYTLSLLMEPALVCCQNNRRVDTLLGTVAGSVPISGDVYVKEGYNCSITLNPGLGSLQINAAPGRGAGVPCATQPATQPSCNDVFLRINGLTADDAGNFALQAGAGMKMTNDPANNKIIFQSAKPPAENQCSGG